MFREARRPFENRHEAGVELASKLRHYAGRRDVVVLALPRGGVPVAFEVAEALDAPLDIFLVRKLGMPGHPALTMRAAVQAVRQYGPARVVVAVPVGAPSTCDEFGDITEETICARKPELFSAVGQWYRNFSQTSDAEVQELLEEHASRVPTDRRS